MKKSLVLLILTANSILAHYCNNGDHFSDCYYADDVCEGRLDSHIVWTLEDCTDTEMHACDNFFQRTNRRLDDWHQKSTHLEDMKKKYSEVIGQNLKLYKNEIKNLQTVVGNYFGHCIIESGDFENHIPPVLDGLEKIENLHWPNWTLALEQDEWEQDDFYWPTALGELRRLGLNNIFFGEHVTLAYNDANKLMLELSVPDDVARFLEHVELTFQMFKIVEKTTYEHEKFIKKVYDLEEKLRTLRGLYPKTYTGLLEKKEIWTLAKLKREIPLFDWQKYFNALLRRPIDDEHFQVQLTNPGYFKDLATLLDQTNEKEIHFYILLRFVYFYLDITPRDVRITCEESVANQFAFGLNYFYNQTVETKYEAKESALQHIFKALKAQLSKNFNRNKYKLSEAHLAYLNTKLEKIELRIGNTPLDLPTEFYDQFYKNVNITGGSKLVNDVHEIMQSRVAKAHERLFTAPSKTELDYNFAYDDGFDQPIEPFYVTGRNLIIVPQSFLAPPFVMPEMNQAFQYATTGFGIARALVEAFLPNEILFDTRGLENSIAYDLLINDNYQADFDCIRKPSIDYEERFPDIPAAQLVMDTFYKDIPVETEGHIEITIYDDEKPNNMRDLFFRYFAQYFRGNKEYTPFSSEYRLNEILKHVPQFAKLYNCTIDTEICTLWS